MIRLQDARPKKLCLDTKMCRGFSADTGTRLEFCPIGTAASGAVISAALSCISHLHLLPVLKNSWNYTYCSVPQQPNSCLNRLTVDVSRSHIIRHTRTNTVGLLWTSDQLVAVAATYATHNKRKRRRSMTSAGFEPTIVAITRLQIYDLDHTATGTIVELHPFLTYLRVVMFSIKVEMYYTVCLQMNGAVSTVNKKFISHLTRAQRTPSAAATVQVSHALPAVRFSCLLRGRGVSLQDGAVAGKGFLCGPF